MGQVVPGQSERFDFMPTGRRIAAGAEPIGLAHGRQWIEPVIEFLSMHLPRGSSGNWEHLYINSYEAACDALVNLGYGDRITEGTMPVAEPALPAVLPRWDDIAAVVVSLAAQDNTIGYRHYPGARVAPNPAGLVRPNIRASNGCGPAFLAPEGLPVFQSLGLVIDGRWTEAAETVLWRDDPAEWAIDFTIDKRFLRARDIALATVPEDIAIAIEKIAVIGEQDIAGWLAMIERAPSGTKTRSDALKNLRLWRESELDDLFHRRWRLADGWLTIEEARRGLRIKNDPVALNMRRAFAARYLPEFLYLFQ
ncbi:hypothetical protein EFD56_21200 [Rhizobium phaseoli]|nr:hypothetical protein EFD56_21200 [Rhizobium phaseoli]